MALKLSPLISLKGTALRLGKFDTVLEFGSDFMLCAVPGVVCELHGK
jgi:hypothetical protein